MIVVFDSSPLHYLILLDQVGVLARLFGTVFVPPMIVRELTHQRTPIAVVAWINAPPPWLVVKQPSHVPPRALDAGETEAIALARELGAEVILMDDRKGVLEARRLGLTVVGTLTLLDRGAAMGLLDMHAVFAALAQTNFRGPKAELERLRDAYPRPAQ